MAFFGLFGRRKRSTEVQQQLDKLTVEEKRERIEDRRTARELVLAAVSQGKPEYAQAAAILRPTRGRPPLALGGNGFNDQLMAAMMARFLEDPEERMERMEDHALRRRERMKRMADDFDDDDDRGSKGILRELLPLAPLLALPLLGNNPAMAQAAAPFIAGMLGAGQTQPNAETTVSQPVQYVPAPTPPVAAPQPEPEVIDAEEIEPVEDEPPTEAQSNVLSGLKPKIVLANLERMDAPTFASWLLHQPGNTMILRVLDQIDVGDPQGTLAQYEGLASTFGWGDVIGWLREHEDQAVAIVEALRGANNRMAEDAGI